VTDKSVIFAPPGTPEQIEEGHVFSPKFDAHGLITCVIADAWTGEVLMVAHMNAEALAKTIETGETWLYSRSRDKLWKKGETSGHTQRLIEMRVDCDQDALLLRVEQAGAGACHTGRETCFYRTVPLRERPGRTVHLAFKNADKKFDPDKVYGSAAKAEEDK